MQGNAKIRVSAERCVVRDKINRNLLDRACILWDLGKLRPAFHLFLRAAKNGDASAQLNLAHFYSDGLITRPNRRKSLRWLNLAVRQGYAPAANNIGMTYRNEGQFLKALRWLQIAGELGDGDAWHEMAKIYSTKMNNSTSAVNSLQRALSSDSITESSKEEAEELLQKLGKRQ